MASLSDDLTTLRKKSDFTIRDIYDLTRIPIDVIEEIENGYIFDPENPRTGTYVRSFIRTYSKALKISDDEITQALDLHDKDAYDGFLVRVRNITTDSTPKTDSSDDTGADASEHPIIENKPKKLKQVSVNNRTGVDYQNEYSRPDPTRIHNQSTPAPPNVGSVNWADMGNRFANIPKASLVPIIAILFLIVIIALSYFGYKYYQENFSSPTVAEIETVQIPEIPQKPESNMLIGDSDSLNAVNQMSTETVIPTTVVNKLPDTLEVLVWAKHDKLEPVRVKTEESGIQNPYWIENNTAMRVTFVKELALRGQYNRMALLFNGHEFVDFNRFKSNDGQFVIKRDFFDDEFWLTPVSLDSLDVKPIRIYDRPIFSND